MVGGWKEGESGILDLGPVFSAVHIALLWSAGNRAHYALLTCRSAGAIRWILSSNTFSKASDRAKNECYLLKELFRQG